MFFYILLSWQVLSGIFCSIILMFFAEDLVALPFHQWPSLFCWLWCNGWSFVRSATRTLGARRANGRDRTTNGKQLCEWLDVWFAPVLLQIPQDLILSLYFCVHSALFVHSLRYFSCISRQTAGIFVGLDPL